MTAERDGTTAIVTEILDAPLVLCAAEPGHRDGATAMQRLSRRALRALALSGSLLALLAAAGPAVSKPLFAVPEDSLVDRIHRIAFSPSIASYSADRPRDSGTVACESLLVARLRSAGFDVVDPATGTAIGRKLVDSLGGLFDPKSGSIDSVRAEFVRSRVIASLKEEQGADGILYWRIVRVAASFSSGTAQWDDMKEKMEKKSFLGKLAGPSYRGTVPAYSILVVIDDRTGRSLYMHRVGIAVGATLEKDRFVDRPLAEVLGDEKRNAAAVEKVLDPFCKAALRK